MKIHRYRFCKKKIDNDKCINNKNIYKFLKYNVNEYDDDDDEYQLLWLDDMGGKKELD